MPLPALPSEGPAQRVKNPSFSPDGDELAAIVDDGGLLVCWNGKGERVYDQSNVAILQAETKLGRAVEWSPDGLGWLLNGRYFFGREQRRVLWGLSDWAGSGIRPARFLARDRLVLVRGDGRERHLGDAVIPWDRINASLAALKQGECYFGPGQTVGLTVETGSLIAGADPAQAAKDIERIVAARLRTDSIRVGNSKTAFVVARYSEESVAPPVQSFPPPNFGRFGRGIASQPSQGHNVAKLELTYRIAGNTKPVWTATLTSTANSAGDAKRGTTPREELHDRLRQAMQRWVLPYFVPKDPELLLLPAHLKP
jgi:hypothetical protein